jgi:hypothetical protein
MGWMMIHTSYMYNYYLCNFLEIIDNKKLKKSDIVDTSYIIKIITFKTP